MAFETMRVNSGRCPPFLVAGLIVTCILLTCNWWTLSTYNYDLLQQLDESHERFRISSKEIEICSKDRMNLQERLRTSEDVAGKIEVKLSQQSNSMQKQLSIKEDLLRRANEETKATSEKYTMCMNELNSVKQLDESRAGILGLLRIEKEAGDKKNQDLMNKNSDLEKQIEKLKEEKNTGTGVKIVEENTHGMKGLPILLTTAKTTQGMPKEDRFLLESNDIVNKDVAPKEEGNEGEDQVDEPNQDQRFDN